MLCIGLACLVVITDVIRYDNVCHVELSSTPSTRCHSGQKTLASRSAISSVLCAWKKCSADGYAIPSWKATATLSLTHSLARSLTRSLPHSLTRSLARSLTHSFTHSLTLWRHTTRGTMAHSLSHLLTHWEAMATWSAIPSRSTTSGCITS